MVPMHAKRRPGWPSLLLLLAAVVVSVPLVLGLFGAAHPAFDSMAHFRMHLAAGMGLLALPLLATLLWREGLVALVFAVAMAVTTMSAQGTAAQAAANDAEAEGITFSLMQFNARFDNEQPKALIRLLSREKPDIVTLQEVSSDMRDWLERTRGTYAHQHYCESGRVIGGAAILSRRPFAAGREPRCLENGYVALASVDLAGAVVDVAAVHLHWPWPHGQAAQIERLTEPLGDLAERAIVAGDFNAAPWSAALRHLALAADADVLSPGPTWAPPRLPDGLRPLVGLPIDHVLVKAIAPLSPARRLGDAGSDHLPVVLRFAVPPDPPERMVVQLSDRTR